MVPLPRSVGRWRVGGTLYVTLEPCAMCAGALLQGRVNRLVYGAKSHLLGAHGSWVDILSVDGSGGNGQGFTPSELGASARRQGGDTILPRKALNQHPFHHGLQVQASYPFQCSHVPVVFSVQHVVATHLCSMHEAVHLLRILLFSHQMDTTRNTGLLCRSAQECMKESVQIY
jgi:hypothetical protein